MFPVTLVIMPPSYRTASLKTARTSQQQPTQIPSQWLELSELLDYVGQVLGQGLPGAVWVRAEVAEITDRRHLYLELVQLDGGQQVAKCRANIWANVRGELEAKLRRATGGGLSAGMSVLLFATAEFHPQYGFALQVQDIAPEYTLGEALSRLTAIRETLQAEGAYTLNRSLPLPDDYTRIAVIAPDGAAGLGDFSREVEPLEEAGVLEIIYLKSTFQGKEASQSLQAALTEAAQLHEAKSLDALVLIRGGGATTDLAWLNDLEVGRALAHFPAPVITGLGHARDNTLPDELAARRTDTPSKAAAYITRTVARAAAEAEADWQRICHLAAAELVDADAGVRWLRDRLHAASTRTVQETARNADAAMSRALSMSVENTLGRGYAVVRSGGAMGQAVTRATQVGSGQRLSLQFADGMVEVVAE